MKYVSTRGTAPVLGFDDVLLTGLADDGGLYVPQSWPHFSADSIRALRGLSYGDLAVEIMAPFVGEAINREDLRRIVRQTYGVFTHPAVAPLQHLGHNQWVMELFHGPTLAFKDYALQFLGRMFDHVLTRRGERVTVVGATSGDTGSAAIEALRDRDAITLFILFPNGRVSDVQRRQMTTVPSANVHCLALEGTFDDCQDAVKALFNHAAFRDEMRLCAINSINWARIMAQVVYYFWAALHVGAPDRPLGFSVPTGNFGNVFAGYVAVKMGLPVERFVIGSNRNDILTRFFETGSMTMNGVHPTISPSMDIQVSSNFERLLFDLNGRDGAAVDRLMKQFRQSGRYSLEKAPLAEARRLFTGVRLEDEETKAVIAHWHKKTGAVFDPHSAIGLDAMARGGFDTATAVVALATAHPAKFPRAVEEACGVHPHLPPRLADLFDRPERFTILPRGGIHLEHHMREKVLSS